MNVAAVHLVAPPGAAWKKILFSRGAGDDFFSTLSYKLSRTAEATLLEGNKLSCPVSCSLAEDIRLPGQRQKTIIHSTANNINSILMSAPLALKSHRDDEEGSKKMLHMQWV